MRKSSQNLNTSAWDQQSQQSFQQLNETHFRYQTTANVTTRIIILISIVAFLVSIFLGINYMKKDSSTNQNIEESPYLKKHLEQLIEWTEKKSKGIPKEVLDEDLAEIDEYKNQNWSLFGKSDCDKYHEQLKNLIPSVSSKLGQFPNLLDAKGGDVKAIKEELFNNKNIFDENEKDTVLNCINQYIDWKQYFESKNEEQKNDLKNFLEMEKNKYENPSKILDLEYIYQLQKRAKDLVKSQRNFTLKKQRLDNFREEYISIKNDLKQCRKNLDEYQTVFQDLQEQENSKKKQLEEMEKIMEGKLNENNEQKKSLNQAQKEYIETKGGLEIEISDLSNDIKNANAIRNTIKHKKQENEDLLKKEQNDNKTIEKLRQENQVKAENINQNNNEITVLERQQMQISHLLTFYEMKIKLVSKDSGIRELLQSMFDKNFSKQQLKLKMEEKINEEKNILTELENYQKQKESYQGEIIIDEEQMGMKEQIEEMIKEQKKTLQEFIEKYNDLEKLIDEYKEQTIEIQNLKQFRQEQLVYFQNNNKKIQSLERTNQELQRNIDYNNGQIEKLEKKNQDSKIQIEQNLEYIQEKEINLSQNEILFENKNKALKEFIEKNQKIEKEIHDSLRQSENEIREHKDRIKEVKTDLAEIMHKRKQMEQDQHKILEECVYLYKYYQEAQKKVEFLYLDFQSTVKEIENIKREYMEYHDLSHLQFFQF